MRLNESQSPGVYCRKAPGRRCAAPHRVTTQMEKKEIFRRWASSSLLPCRSMATPWRSCLTHLECSACGLRHDADQLQTVCTACGKVLFARYDLEGVRQSVKATEFSA